MLDRDWLPGDRAGILLVMRNTAVKAPAYIAKFGWTNGEAETFLMIADAYEAILNWLSQNRASNKTASGYADLMLEGKTGVKGVYSEGETPDSAPQFVNLNLPAEAKTGLERMFRRMVAETKIKKIYDKGIDGQDLMWERAQNLPLSNFDEVFPELKWSVSLENVVNFTARISIFEQIEYQFRRLGATMWQSVDKTTERNFTHTPPLAVPGMPENFEYRAVGLIKNERVGRWSPIYKVRVG